MLLSPVKGILNLFRPQTRFERHSMAWIFFILTNSVLFSIGEEPGRFIEFVADYVLSLPIILITSYISVYLLIPLLFSSKKTILAVFTFLVLLFVSGILEHMKTQLLLLPLINPETNHPFTISINNISRGSFFILIPTIYFITLKYARDWYRMIVLKTEEEKKQLRNELKYLKSQVHPNFLLITLTNLEKIAAADPVNAAPGIEKISEILNFILYECNFPKIKLSKEMEQVKSFIELQEMNYKENPFFKFSIIGPIHEVYLAPLMIFTIVEFYFKKRNDYQNKAVRMNIFLEVFDNLMNFRVEGENFGIDPSEPENDTGLINLKKRIELIYGKNCELTFSNSSITMVIQLNLKYLQPE